MDKEDVVYIYNEILHDNEKEWNLAIAATWMELEGIMISEISQSEDIIWFHPYVEFEKLNRWS